MKLRIQVTKEGDVRFISHLEYFRVLNRAIRRVKLPAAYSEGFNPHIKMSLASALGLGIASLSEYAEIEIHTEIEPEKAKELLNQNLPQGIRVLAADVVEKKTAKLMAVLTGASYKIKLKNIDSMSLVKAIEEYNQLQEVLFIKKMPPGKPKKQIDMKQFVKNLEYKIAPEVLELYFDSVITPSGTIKAYDILFMLKEQFAVQLEVLAADITRTALYKDDKQPLIARGKENG